MVRPKPKENGLKPMETLAKDESVFIMKSLVNEKETALFFLEEIKKAKSSQRISLEYLYHR